MEVFTSPEMKREFQELVEKIVPSLNDCGNYNVFKCASCLKFSADCQSCRLWKCKNCTSFQTSKEILMNNCNNYSREYVANFLTDYFKISDITAEFFNLSISSETVKEKNNIFLSKKELKKHIDFVQNFDSKDKVEYVVKRKNAVFSVNFFKKNLLIYQFVFFLGFPSFALMFLIEI